MESVEKILSVSMRKARVIIFIKEGPLTKNGPIDFAQSWAIHMKKSN
jgi:hypothetical protein